MHMQFLQGLMSAVGAQPGSIQINTMGPIPMSMSMQGEQRAEGQRGKGMLGILRDTSVAAWCGFG